MLTGTRLEETIPAGTATRPFRNTTNIIGRYQQG